LLDTLGAPDRNSKKGGRRSEIDDAALLDRCSRLLGPLQYQWSEIGWHLQRAKTLSDIRCAFESVKEPWRQDFELFLNEPSQKATMKEARALRKRIKRLGVLVRDAYLAQRQARERLDRALQIAADHSEDEKTLKLCKERRAQHASTVLVLGELEHNVEGAREDVQKQNAFLAQSALLKLIKDKRCELLPVNFAQAMAGLPYMSCRQSRSRCKDHPIANPYGFEFETFQEASRALKELPQDTREAVASVGIFDLQAPSERSDRATQT
jgi:hypothetical protein